MNSEFQGASPPDGGAMPMASQSLKTDHLATTDAAVGIEPSPHNHRDDPSALSAQGGEKATAALRDVLPPDHAEELWRCSVKWIVLDHGRARRGDDRAKVAALAASIKELGLLNPPLVYIESNGSPPVLRLVSGHLRIAAVRELGWREVLVRVLDDKGLGQCIALAENTARHDLSPIDLAAAVEQLIEAHGLKQEEVAKRLGMSRPSISKLLRLNRLPIRVALEIKSLQIAPKTDVLVEVAAMKPKLQQEVLPLLASGEFSRDDARRVRKEGSIAAIEPGAKEHDAFVRHLKAASKNAPPAVGLLSARGDGARLGKLAELIDELGKPIWAALDKLTTPTSVVMPHGAAADEIGSAAQ